MSFEIDRLDPDRLYGIEELTGGFGLQRWEVARLVQRGALQSPGTGTYVHHEFVPGEHDDLAVVAIRSPSAVFHLHTASDLHGMNNRNLPGIYLGIPAAQRVPSIGRNFVSDLIVTRWSRDADSLVGIEERIVRKVTVRLTDQERTVCDMWRNSFHNPGVRGNPRRIGDAELNHCLICYLDQNDGATGALADMMEKLEAPRSSQDAFVQFLRTFTAGYERERVF